MNPEPPKLTVPFKLGDGELLVIAHQKAPATLTMLNVHCDEKTSVQAGLTNIQQHGGRVIEFAHPGERLVVFHLDGQKYAFDPNRIFSEAGIKATLEKHSAWSQPAQAAVQSFAAAFINHFALDREPVIIALHNITDAIFSIESFLPDGEHGAAAVETYVSPRRNRYDFYFVTDKRFYDHLKARDFNVTLQDNQNTPDDGSLSVYFARRGVPYVNIEADMDHLTVQIEMVSVAREMVGEIIRRPEKP